MIHLRDIFLELIEDNSCVYCGNIVDEDLYKWFKKVVMGEQLLVVGIDMVRMVKNLENVVVVKRVVLMPRVLVLRKLLNLVKKVEQHL